ncbi:MAG: hypothetical protein E6G62_09690, partial [Actinobacteria bacterium]
MRRNGYIVLLVAAVAWVTVAIVLGTGKSGARPVPPSGPSPSCLATGTVTANPNTQVSFRGTPVTDIQHVAVEGSHSGYHRGHLYGYFQGDGGSFVAETPFLPGERVSVRALLGPTGGERRVAFDFRIATPYPTDGVPGFPNPPAPASSSQSFVSAPSLHPPILNVTAADRDPGAGSVMVTSGPGPG